VKRYHSAESESRQKDSNHTCYF